MKAVLLSIQPKWCELIASRKKTIEVRKTKPKLDVPFKCYIYQTQAKQRLLEVIKDGDQIYGEEYHGKPLFIKTNNDGCHLAIHPIYMQYGKVIGEFVCNKIDWIGQSALVVKEDAEKALGGTCLSVKEIYNYLGLPNKSEFEYKECYGWRISSLVIYDKPKKLSEFQKACDRENCGKCKRPITEKTGCVAGLTRPPQSWCYVEAIE